MKRIIFCLLPSLFLFFPVQVSPQGFAYSPWPMFGRDPGHTHRGVSAPPATNVLKWKFKAESGIFSPVIGSDGTIYAGSYDKHVYAINPDGTLKWKYELNGPVGLSSPAVGSDGTIYIGSSGTDGGNKAYLYAIHSDGTLKWKSIDNNYSFISSPIIGYDGTIFIASTDDYLYAVDENGNIRWKYKFMGITNMWPAISRDGTIYFASGDSYLYALNSDGTLKWKYEHDITNGWQSPSVGDDGTIYIGTKSRELAAFNPDGTLKWKSPLTTGFSVIYASPAIGADGTIYIGSIDFSLFAFNPDGTLKWRFPVDGLIMDTAAVGSDGCIYVPADTDNSHYMYAINPDGTLRWKFPIGQASTPVIGADGTLYFGSDIGYLCALVPEKQTAVEQETFPFSINKPYPNPFNPSTSIAFSLNAPSRVKVAVYSINGQKVADLTNKTMSAGRHSVVFDGSKHASGVYFYRFESDAGIRTGKMLLVK